MKLHYLKLKLTLISDYYIKILIVIIDLNLISIIWFNLLWFGC